MCNMTMHTLPSRAVHVLSVPITSQQLGLGAEGMWKL